MPFAIFLARFPLGMLPLREMPAAALAGVEEGYKSVLLAALAGMDLTTSEWQIEQQWARAIADLDVSPPSRLEAAVQLKRYWAGLVASGAVSPREGAGQIIEVATTIRRETPDREYAGDGFGIPRLLGLFYSHMTCSMRRSVCTRRSMRNSE